MEKSSLATHLGFEMDWGAADWFGRISLMMVSLQNGSEAAGVAGGKAWGEQMGIL